MSKQGNLLKNIEEFKCSLNKESWQEVSKTSEANAYLTGMYGYFRYYFSIALPSTSVYVSK
jgi:hypothetical protein